MKRYTLLLTAFFITIIVNAQRITCDFRGVSMSKALKKIEASTDKYTINFIYNELEDFTVAVSVDKKSIPDAVKDIIGFYPIRMSVDGDNIFVECVQKENEKLIGDVVDNNGQAVMYANVSLLSPTDSSFINGGVSNEAGHFVIPCSNKNVLVKISCIGYKTIFRLMTVGKVGKITMNSEMEYLKEVTVNGHRQLFRQKDGALITDVAGSLLSKSTDMNELLIKIPGMVKTASGDLEVFGAGSPIIYINNRKINNNAELQSLLPKNIKDVELITNPGAKYDATGRAVLIIHTLDQEDGFMFQTSTKAKESYYPCCYEILDAGYKKGGLSLSMHYDYNKWKMRVNQPVEQKLNSDADIYSYESEQHDIRKYYIQNWQANIEYAFSNKQVIGLEYDGTYQKSNTYRKLYLNYLVNGNNEKQLDIDINNPNDVKNYDHINIYHNASWSKELTSDLNFDYVYSHDSGYQTNNETNVATKEASNTSNRSNSNYNIYSGQLNFDYKLYKSLNLSWGIVGSLVRSKGTNEYDNSVVSPSNYNGKEDKFAIYAVAKISLGKFSLKGGLRYENLTWDYIDNFNNDNNIHRDYNDFFPSFSISNSMKEWNNTLSFTSKIRRPSFTQLSDCSYYLTEYLYQQGNPLLKPVNSYRLQWTTVYKILTFFLRYEYNKNYIDNGWSTPEDRPNVIISTYTNYDKAQDIVSGLTLTKNTSWWEGILQIMIDKPIFSAYYLGERLNYKSPRITVIVDNTFQLPHLWIINPYFMYCNGGNRATIKFKSYWDLTFSVKKSFFDEHLTFSLDASDIFHKLRYRESECVGRLFFQQTEDYNQWYYALTVKYRFNNKSHNFHGKNSAQDEINRL
jgi:hypothetical protein